MIQRTRGRTCVVLALLAFCSVMLVMPVLGGAPGAIASWGDDEFGQVSQTPASSDVIAVAGGAYHNVALRADGSIVSWGRDDKGQVSQTPAGTGFTAIAAGAYHSLALRADGSIVGWGDDTNGQVSQTPTGTGFTAIAAGGFHGLALRPDGSIVIWGYNWEGEMPQAPTGTGFTAVAAGKFHSLARPADGSIVSWSYDAFGQVSQTPADAGYAAVAAGGYHSLALRTDGSIVSWGDDRNGQVSQTPTGAGFAAVSGGGYHSLALRADGSIVSWGYDTYGQVSQTPAGSGFTAVSGGKLHSLALRGGTTPPVDTTPPGSVSSLRVETASMTSVTWTWTDPADADFAKVDLYLNGVNRGFVAKGVQRFVATGLAPNTPYRLSAVTLDTAGNYNWTVVTGRATTLADGDDLTPPGTIANLAAAERTTTSITWTWTDPADADLATVAVYADGVFAADVPAGVRSFTLTGLAPSTAHRLSTMTCDLAGNYNRTVVSLAAVTSSGDSTPPATITGLSATSITPTSITWTWTDPADADFAKVRLYGDGVSAGYVDRGVQTYTMTGLAPNTAHRLSTMTYDLAGNYNATVVSHVAVTSSNDLAPPGTITNLAAAERTTTSITWTWTDPADADFAKVDVYLNGVNRGFVAKGVQRFVATGLAPNTPYRLSVVTLDTAGQYNWTVVTGRATTLADGDDLTPPGTITNLAAAERTTTSITWTWTDPADADLATVAVFADGVFATDVPAGVRSYTLTGLAPDTAHRLSAMTSDLAGNYNATVVSNRALTLP